MRRRLAAAAVVLLALLAAAPAAHAAFGLVPGSFEARILDAGGQPEQRAGAHPDRLVIGFAFATNGDLADGNVKDVAIDLPAGMVGNARTVPACPRPKFTAATCPPESQVGVMRATFLLLGAIDLPIYNIAPAEGELAEFGFTALILPVRLVASVRADSDFGTHIELHDLPQNVPMIASRIELWGVPASHQTPAPPQPEPAEPPIAAESRGALLSNPVRCDGPPMTTTLSVRSWQQPASWIGASAAASGPLTGCEALSADPSLGLALDSQATDTPSGMQLDLTVPQSDDTDGRATAQLRDVAITFPSGVTLSPGVASGLSACDDDQLGVGSVRASACPPASKIGTVQLQTPLIAAPLSGDVYLGLPNAADGFRLFIVANGPGFALKLVGSLRPDPRTGRLTTVLSDLPQVPFSRLSLRFKGGPRAPLATPLGCGSGTGTARATLYSSGRPVEASATIAISSLAGGAPCPNELPFAPQLSAGTSPAVGGVSGSFSMTVRRGDGQQALERVALTLPPGLTAHLAAVPACPQAQAAAAACPAASRVGSVAVEAGAGALPTPLAGDMYLTGPQGSAPFGLSLVLRARVGPLDLGTIVVPAALRVDPLDASLSVSTGTLPQIVAGVPLRLQTLALDIDRRGFMLNPTSCQPVQIVSTIRSATAGTATPTARFAIGDCGRLRFKPAIAMSAGPSRQLRRGAHPELRIEVRPRAGQANLRSVAIELPDVLTFNGTAVDALCSRALARDGRCPKGSVVGSARVRTPLLKQPLNGTVSAVRPAGTGQPELWLALAGAGVRLAVRSTTAVPRGKPIVNTFVDLPDIPMSGFTLRLRGGRNGLLSVARDLCRQPAQPLLVRASMLAHNGARRSGRVRVRARPACAAARRAATKGAARPASPRSPEPGRSASG